MGGSREWEGRGGGGNGDISIAWLNSWSIHPTLDSLDGSIAWSNSWSIQNSVLWVTYQGDDPCLASIEGS